MNPATASDDRSARRLATLYSALNSLAWAVLCLAPLGTYCFQMMSLGLLWWFLAASAVPWFSPKALLARMQFAPTARAYRHLGLGLAQRLTRNGVLVNWLVRRRYPHYRFMPHSALARRAVLTQTYRYERFHWAMALFFTLAMGHALLHRRWVWAGVLLLTNLVFNLYPILLQQYLRLRLTGLLRPSAG